VKNPDSTQNPSMSVIASISLIDPVVGVFERYRLLAEVIISGLLAPVFVNNP